VTPCQVAAFHFNVERKIGVAYPSHNCSFLQRTNAGFPVGYGDDLRKPKISARDLGVVIAGEFYAFRANRGMGSFSAFSVCGGGRKVQRLLALSCQGLTARRLSR
jgi:hypothetical protein